MSCQRNLTIDLFRFIFAFLVITIHLPMMGNSLLRPIARCGVPFFYMVTGYYMFRPEIVEFKKSIIINLEKWLILYVTYLTVFAALSITLQIGLEGDVSFKWSDAIYILVNGSCPSLDEIYYNGGKYGILVIWFLYCGTIGLVIVYFLSKFVYYKMTLPFLALILSVMLMVNTVKEDRLFPQFFLLSIPYLFTGAYIKCHIDVIAYMKHKGILILLILVCYFISILEYYSSPKVLGGEYLLSTFFLSVFIFILLTNYKNGGGNNSLKVMKVIPVKCSMDIYLWHRLIFLLICMFGIQLGQFASVYVFIVIFSLSFILRRYIHPKIEELYA